MVSPPTSRPRGVLAAPDAGGKSNQEKMKKQLALEPDQIRKLQSFFAGAIEEIFSPLRGLTSKLPPVLRFLSPVKLAALYLAFGYAAFRWITGHWESLPRAILGKSWLGEIHTFMLRAFSTVLGVRLPNGFEVPPNFDPDRQYFFCFHPHGAVTWTAFCFGATMITNNGTSPLRRQMMCGIADVLFSIPIIRELLLFSNARSANPKVMGECANNGLSLALNPGGVHEQLQYRNDQEEAYFPNNLGFIRIALRHGVPLVPMYFFGENQIFTSFGESGTRFSQWLYKTTGYVFLKTIQNKH